MIEAIIRAENIHYSYSSDNTALNGISMEIPKGKRLAILGPNGAGKSTLFMHFNGLLKPDSGRLFFRGKPFKYNRRGLLELRQQVGIVFQDPDTQLFSASVEQEIAFGPLNLGLPKPEVKRRVEEITEVIGLAELCQKPTHLLSYGQKKRVAIAAVLAMQPEVLVFDEPTAWLDPQGCRQIITLLDELNTEGKTVVLSTHDVDLAYSWADEVLVIRAGQKIAAGGCVEVLGDQELLLSADLALPSVMEIYRGLEAEGLVSSKIEPPRNIAQLLKSVKKAGTKTRESRKEVMA